MTGSNYLTLTTFVPGTKAKADEVNSNFSILKDAINEKATIDGDSTQVFSVANATADKHAVNKSQLDDLSDSLTAEVNKTGTKFCVKSGHTTNGEGDLFSFSVLQITPLIGGTYGNLVMVDYKGTQTTISSASQISMSGKPDGDYNIFINTSGVLYTLSNKIYRQKSRPTMNDGDIWFNTSKEPFSCIKYDGTNDNEFLDIPLGLVTIKSAAITALKTFPFNQNGYNVNMYSFPSTKFDYANPVNKSVSTTYTAECDGLLYGTGFSTEGGTSITVDGVTYTIIGYSSQGEYVGGMVPIAKGQVYSFSGYGNRVYQFIPQVTV